MSKPKGKCLFCRSICCYERIVSSHDNGKTYDEVACNKHSQDLRTHSDANAPNVMKYFISSTGKQLRGENLNIVESEVK